MPDENEQKVQEMADSVKAPAEANVGAASALDETMTQVIEKINDAESILVTLSKKPNIDEIAAALGLTLVLDRMGKHVTALYSGEMPDEMKFLEPERTFEKNTNSLQDFIISLNKEKVDHLRYKIEGDFVRVYITPYKTKISADDLEFADGEMNVDLVICMNVMEASDLDAALSEHGRVMHDAGVINVSNSIPGRTLGLEWNDGEASSVSEMIVKLMNKMGQEMSQEIATALLTGIVAETERFSNEKTSPVTMTLASELMKAGADQQLVAAHVMPADKLAAADVTAAAVPEVPAVPEVEPGSIEVNDEVAEPSVEPAAQPVVEPAAAPSVELSPEQQLEQMISASVAPAAAPVMDELAKAVPKVPEVPEAQPEMMPETLAKVVPEVPVEPVAPVVEPVAPVVEPSAEAQLVAAVPTAQVPVDKVYERPADMTDLQNGVVTPVEIEQPKDYGAMMEEALAEEVPGVPAQPEVMPVATPMVGAPEEQSVSDMVNQMVANAQNPVTQAVPAVPAAPEVPATPVEPAMQTAPVMQTVPVEPTAPVVPVAPEPQGGVELPPPPAPPVDMGMPMAEPSLPPVQPPVPEQVVPQPVAQPMEQPMMQPVAQPMVQSMEQPMPQPMAQPAGNVEPQDSSAVLGIPEAPAGVVAPPEPVNPVVVQPGPDPASVPPVQDPGAFKIPGM